MKYVRKDGKGRATVEAYTFDEATFIRAAMGNENRKLAEAHTQHRIAIEALSKRLRGLETKPTKKDE